MAGLPIGRILYATDTANFGAIIDWYKTVFGATFTKINGGKDLWLDPDGAGPGDHIISPAQTYLDTWVPMVSVNSVGDTVKKLPNGEKPLIAETQLDDTNWYAVFKDPAGARIGVIGGK